MITLVFSTLLLGAALAMRFKVLILIPSLVLASIVIVTIGIAAGKSAAAIVIAIAIAACCLQFGYLAGACARLSRAIGGTGRSLLQPGRTR
jgi:hypothetical protein